jgi:two-component system OmpR family response regulator/two-component system KDP operon response regulator KdpE
MPEPKSILLVDDDKFLLDLYAVKFKEKGLSLEAVSDPEEALARLRSGFAPDVILLDVIMPGLDGFSLLEHITKEKLAPRATIIMLTNQGQESDIARAKELGAKGYIIKASAVPSEVLEQTLKIANS